MPVMTVGTGRALFGENKRYLLLDRFLTDQAAPLGATRVCEPGPGSLSVVDASSVMSLSGGVLQVNGTPGANSSLSSALFPRKCGRAFAWKVINRTTINSNARFGFSTSPTNNSIEMGLVYLSTNAIQWRGGTTGIDSASFGAGDNQFLAIMRDTGGYLIYRVGTGAYLLAWVYGVGTADMYAKMFLGAGSTQNFQSDDWLVQDFGGPWGTDYGLAQAAGSYSAMTVNGQTFTHTTAFFLEHTITAQTGVTQELVFRQSNASNCWILRMDQGAGTIDLVERNGGGETVRASAAQTWTDGTAYRVVVRAVGNGINTYVNETAKHSFSSSFNSGATGGSVSHAGANLATYPQNVTIYIPLHA